MNGGHSTARTCTSRCQIKRRQDHVVSGQVLGYDWTLCMGAFVCCMPQALQQFL
jgi:hypothetical protein